MGKGSWLDIWLEGPLNQLGPLNVVVLNDPKHVQQ